MPGRPARADDAGAPAVRSTPAQPTSRRRAPGTSSVSTRPARRCCASAAWSTSSSRCRTPSTRCGAIRCAACSAQPSAARPSVGVVAVGGAALRRGLLRPVERDLPAHPGARLARLRGAGRVARAFRHGAAQARVAVRPGRVKEAVRMALFQQTGTLLYPSDITVLHDDLGAPFVDGWWRGELAEAPQVSLSHTARACLVAVACGRVAGGRRLRGPGPDPAARAAWSTRSPPASARRSQGLAGAALDERLLRLWCAKEAAAKYLGRRPAGAARSASRSASSTTPARARGSSSRARRSKSGSSATAPR